MRVIAKVLLVARQHAMKHQYQALIAVLEFPQHRQRAGAV
jgi:hypothetical protein